MVFDNDAHPKCQTHELCSQLGSPGWCKMKQGIARWCKMVLPSFVKLVFCWCVQPSVCRSLRQWFFVMSNSWVVFSVWKSESKCSHLCLQLRSSTASWCRAYFVSQRADALHWIVRWSWYWAWSCALLRFFSISIATMFAHLCLQLRSPSGAALCERLCVKVCKSVCV